jgi:hypothetical protein
MQDLERGSASVHVGRVRPEFGLPDSDLEISYEGRDPLRKPTGRPVTVNGRAALVDQQSRAPAVCVLIRDQDGYVCVSSSISDTGPYPDRSDAIPTLLAIAESLTFATDLHDTSTWFAADRVFG